ncbi:SWIM zinc finger family protein [Planctomicrobium sp.]|jgi:hypothetical protein|nr:SWIM zinc finger family protein [Planctomicrobium sp.]MDB4733509.1 SWIM zinc finger family protein [Planctomicrobium sp.]MDB4743062.1 SWIM zinc finger family protein [Planctomicrobium sp.]
MEVSHQQIREIAPDEKSMVAANKLLSSKLWSKSGLSEGAVWGICGGGRNYQVGVDFADMGFRCNCPSRKFPCKHVLALLLLLSSSPDIFSLESSPDWLDTWLEKRRLKREQKATRESEPAKPVDKEAQAKRIKSRENNVSDGIEQLIIWLDDLIRSGIAALETKPFSFWDTQARRLIDAQAKGLANRVRNLAEIPGSSQDWSQRMLEELGSLRLLVQAYQRQDTLSPNLQAEVRQLVGWTVSQTELELNGDSVTDDWFIWGQRIEDDERFRLQRSWAIGLKSEREALILQFAPGKQGFPEVILPGTLQQGAVNFYPGAVPQRAKFVNKENSENTASEIPVQASISEFLETYASRLALNPWLASCGCLIENVTLSIFQNQWWIRDKSGAALPCRLKHPFELLSITEGEHFQVHAEWNGRFLTPMSYLYQGQLNLC